MIRIAKLDSNVFRDADIALLIDAIDSEVVYVEGLRDGLEKALVIGVDV